MGWKVLLVAGWWYRSSHGSFIWALVVQARSLLPHHGFVVGKRTGQHFLASLCGHLFPGTV